MKILLCYVSGCHDRIDPYISLLPIGLCYLQGTLVEAGFDAVLANFSAWKEAAIVEQLNKLSPQLVGISQWTHNRHASIELARIVRRACPKAIIVLGGAHATYRCDAALAPESPIDAVVLGEGEATLGELAGRIADNTGWRDINGIAYHLHGEIMINAPRPRLPDLDQLPFAARYLDRSVGVDSQLQAGFVITARGCPSACRFCSSPGFWGRRVSFRSPENIVDELVFLRDTHGLLYFSLRDDTFTADRQRALDMCRLMVARRLHIIWNCQSRVSCLDEELLVWMKRAGCECVQLGVESGAQRTLDRLGKAISPGQVETAAALIKKVGINLSVYLISDIPEETEEDLSATVTLMRRIRPDDGNVSPLAYYPGTRLFDEAVTAGRLATDAFETSTAQALYAKAKRGEQGRRLLKVLHQAGEGARRFAAQKRLIGYCATTNVLAGEWYRQAGDLVSAEVEYREITEREPDNPWGWYLLAELYAELGERQVSAECYVRVLALVPNHQPSLKALGKKSAALARSKRQKKRGQNGPAEH